MLLTSNVKVVATSGKCLGSLMLFGTRIPNVMGMGDGSFFRGGGGVGNYSIMG